MSKDSNSQRLYRLISDSGSLFWILNGLGWAGVVIITFLSLSLPYNQFDPFYTLHNISQAVLGMMVCLPMRYIFRWVWDWPVWPRIGVGAATVLLLSTIWAIARLLLFMLMTPERGLWADFGGWLFPSIFLFLAWAALYHGIKYYQLLQREQEVLLQVESRQQDEALKLAKAEAAAHDAQLRLLRYQLNPHFLFNTLNSVAALMGANRTDDASKMLLQLSTFLRFSLDSEHDATVSLNEEIEAVGLYLKIEQVRFVDRMRVEVQVEEPAASCPVPSLILQPLVENAIKYAISRSEAGGIIRIVARRMKKRLRIVIEDSGPDRSYQDDRQQTTDGTAHQESGIGLQNIRARLENLYGLNYRMTSGTSKLGGFMVSIELPAEGAEDHVG